MKPASIRPMKLKERPGVLLRTPFSRAFNRTLKGMVPQRDRWFNEYAGGWWIAETHADVVEHLAREAFGAVEVVDSEGDTVVSTAGGERLHQESLL